MQNKMTVCKHCGMDIAIRNPSGYCDHLYYPEGEIPKEKVCPNHDYNYKDDCCQCMINRDINKALSELTPLIAAKNLRIGELEAKLEESYEQSDKRALDRDSEIILWKDENRQLQSQLADIQKENEALKSQWDTLGKIGKENAGLIMLRQKMRLASLETELTKARKLLTEALNYTSDDCIITDEEFDKYDNFQDKAKRWLEGR